MLAVVGGAVVSSPVAGQESVDVVEVRIVARKLDSGRVEFGLQQRQPDNAWGDRQLPRVRFFPTTAAVGRWLVSSSLRLITPQLAAQPAGEGCGGDTARPCDPPQVGETIVLTAGHPDTNPDLEFYCDSGDPVGDSCTFGLRVSRTARAYPVAVGTRIRILDDEEPDRSWREFVVLCLTDEPVERTDALTEDVWGATMRSTVMQSGFVRSGRPEAFYALYPGLNGRWHLRLGSPLGSASDC